MRSVAAIETFQPIKKYYPEVSLIDFGDSFTHNLMGLLLDLGAPVQVLHLPSLSPETILKKVHGFVVLSPGPGKPGNYPPIFSILSHTLPRFPHLGICLGMQCLNAYYGGRTLPAPKVMHGKVSLLNHDGTGVFIHLPSPLRVARYHSLQVGEVPGALSLQGWCDGVPMAFHEPGWIGALQFHPESFLTQHGVKMLENALKGRL